MFWFFLLDISFLNDENGNYKLEGANVSISSRTSYGNCSCAINSRICTPFCCCDPSCSEDIKKSFPYCLPGSLSTLNLFETNCSSFVNSTNENLFPWWHRAITCVVRNSNPSKGNFFILTTDDDLTDSTNNPPNKDLSFAGTIEPSSSSTRSLSSRSIQSKLETKSSGYLTFVQADAISKECVLVDLTYTNFSKAFECRIPSHFSYPANKKIVIKGTFNSTGEFKNLQVLDTKHISTGDIIKVEILPKLSPLDEQNKYPGYKVDFLVNNFKLGFSDDSCSYNSQSNYEMFFGQNYYFTCFAPYPTPSPTPIPSDREDDAKTEVFQFIRSLLRDLYDGQNIDNSNFVSISGTPNSDSIRLTHNMNEVETYINDNIQIFKINESSGYYLSNLVMVSRNIFLYYIPVGSRYNYFYVIKNAHVNCTIDVSHENRFERVGRKLNLVTVRTNVQFVELPTSPDYESFSSSKLTWFPI